MTMKELIEKMKNEDNGMYYLLETWYEEATKKISIEEMGYAKWQLAEEKKQMNYNTIDGFLWGICSTGYISEDERQALTEQLIKES